MTDFDIYELKEALVVFLRNNDIISTANRGVTTGSDTGTYTNATSHTLAQSNPKNVRSITIGGTAQVLGTDYTVNYDTKVITYTVAKTGDYTISYDYGTTDRIFSDFPQADLKLSAFPRIAVDIISAQMTTLGLGGTAVQHDYDVTVVCYSTDTEELEDMISAVLTACNTSRKTFFNTGYLEGSNLGPILNSPGKGDKVLQRNADFKMRFNFKTN